ncbi:flagellar hook protein FlgE [Methyloversatilis thermotolerans]|uniref:flagellar hook protein FlgE n=1 Tax=Methyloversatilis thermotolerans TaxID=1346290 RepID=UPI000382B0F0|nr:flagellar hook-basal body complex protein [Methyloversatilis thermotolerans]
MSYEIALSGINAINTQLETISNNIANTGTYGYKSSRANFAAMYAGTQPTGVEVASLTQSIDIGGSVSTTGRGLDAAIQGRGFFVTHDSSGASMYSRVGIFSTDKDGFIVDTFGRKLQGYEMLPGSTTLGAMGDLKVPAGQIPAEASDTAQYVGNMSADWTTPTAAPFDPTNPLTFNSSQVMVVYDSLGGKHSLGQYFVKSGTNQVTAHYTFDGVDLGTTTALDFNTSGALVTPAAPVSIALGTPAGANALTVAIDYTGTTQFGGDATVRINSADGFASGTMIGVQIAEDGSVIAQYSNNRKEPVGKIALAVFPDEGSLIAESDTSWTSSPASGEPLFFTPGEGMAGSLTGGALEQSNVDMTSELVSLMTAQRNYQANSKVISTQTEMMQALMQAV